MTDAMWELWRAPQVSARTGLGKTMIYKMMAEDRFPRPRQVGGRVAWLSNDVIAWIQALPVNSPTAPGAGTRGGTRTPRT